MTLTIAPSDEACAALVTHLNSGSGATYTLPTAATYGYKLNQKLTDVTGLQVFVLHLNETTLNETLDLEDRSSHDIQVFIRSPLTVPDPNNVAIAVLNLIARQIFQRLNNVALASTRVQIWDCGETPADPDQQLNLELGFFERIIDLRVEVDAP